MKRSLFAAFVGVAALSHLAACGGDRTTTQDDGPTTIVDGSGRQDVGSDPVSLEVSATEKDGDVSGS